MLNRKYIYESIDSERKYQDNLDRNVIKNQTPLEHLSIIRKITRDMEDWFYNNPGQPPMDYMRKIAAVAVKCMEEHGAPFR